MRSTASILILLAMILGAAWLVLGTPPDPDGVKPQQPAPGQPAPEQAESVDSDDAVRRRVSVPLAEVADGDPDSADAEPVESSIPARVVRVVDSDRDPLSGVPVRRYSGAMQFTDARGEVQFHDPDVGKLALPSLGRSIEPTEELTVVTVADAVPLEVRCVDLETGRPLDVAWSGDDRPSHRRAVSWVVRGQRAIVPLDLTPPEGWAWTRNEPGFAIGRAARGAASFVLTMPVPREARVRVRVVRHDGSPAADALVTARTRTKLSGKPVELITRTDEEGTADVRGIPFRRGERLHVTASLPIDGAFALPARVAQADPVRLTDPGARIDLAIRLPDEVSDWEFPDVRERGTIGVGGGGGPAAGVQRTASIRVYAKLRSGAPAESCLVQLVGAVWRSEQADARGAVSFGELPAGAYGVWLLEPGVVPTSVDVTIADAETRTVELVEAPGRSLEVAVVDLEGAPLPGARVVATLGPGLSGRGAWSYAHVIDGEHDLDPVTDAAGRIRLVGLPEDVHAVVVRFGSRRTLVRPGTDAGPVRVVLPDAD